MNEEIKGVSRRTFLKGAVGVAGVTALGLSGCTSNVQTESTGTTKKAFKADEVISCDIVIIGVGASGLAAAVEAGEAGAKVVCIEGQSTAGGGARGVEGCFAVGSRMQKEQGIKIPSLGKLVREELETGQFRSSGEGYIDLIKNSGENLDWLLDHGVKFGEIGSGDKSNPHPNQVFHYYESGAGAQDYVVPMLAAAEKAGVRFMYKTKGESLIMDEAGAAKGVYASTGDGKTLQINASSVIVATGGFAENLEYVAENGINTEYYHYEGFPGSDGSGNRMVVEAGGANNRQNAAYLNILSIKGLPGYFQNGKFSFWIGVAAPYAIWVNEKGRRFVNEDFAGENPMSMAIPVRSTKKTFIVMDQALMDKFTDGDAEAIKQLQDGLNSGEIVSGNSVDELAKAMNVDPANLNETFERYNASCKQQDDAGFGKDPSALISFNPGSLYGLHVGYSITAAIGSIKTDNNFNAIDTKGNPIKGLYVVGIEGTMLWANMYTFKVGGTCNGNNINSGRTAAKNALALMTH
ncbi:FAD-dependent oxidoreductase [Desulfitobacterium chlororespirans]|uniref:Fumarate reductase flavoprotein subunit n=1 Tax=Desulfitobacterium chlororespirans DSM 11544 TaxID=1121395 RepID=A0A1M7TVC1_9FIRM|nr:FAD-dependent oxidoreductase [Desulfitobacterium chlororespirans]SHN74694.1 fumarate reductase flavoprotein subunit [Desulfitobacterium chlororespirans DSM 11544]